MSSTNRRVLSVAGGTLASRLTGLVRTLVLAWVLGFTPLADAFNLANTVPNMLFDLVLGGIASATFIPVFVERLAVDGERRAWGSISSVVTAATMVLAAASLAAWFGAGQIIHAFTILNHQSTVAARSALDAQRAVATELLRWFVPQIFFYGMIGLTTALLNVRARFAAAAWVPIANNVVCVAILIWFHFVSPNPTINSVNNTSHLMWLGLGTTAGVAVQFVLLWPSLAKANVGRLRFRPRFADPAVRAVARLGSWTLAVVVANQISLYVVLAVAFGIGGAGPVSAYTYGWSFMQMPYAVVVASVLGVLTPQLSQLATERDWGGFRDRLGLGLRQSLVIIWPATFLLIVLAKPLVAILLNHADASGPLGAATVLAVLSAGLPGFTIFQLCVRGLQSTQRASSVFWLYVLDNALSVALSLLWGRHSLAGLTAAVSVGYAVSAAAALVVLARAQAPLAPALWSAPVRRSMLAGVFAALAMALLYSTTNAVTGFGLVVRTGGALVGGAFTFALLVGLGQRRHQRRRENLQGWQRSKGGHRG